MSSYEYYSHECQIIRDILDRKEAYFNSVKSGQEELIWHAYNGWMKCRRKYKEIFNHDLSPEDCEHCRNLIEESQNKPDDERVAGVMEIDNMTIKKTISGIEEFDKLMGE